MTNAELIQKIRAEIERRITDNIFEAKLELIDILAWLDTLESEKPVNQGELEKAVVDYFEGYWPGMETAEQCNTDLHFTPPAIMRLIRHFVEWGKEQGYREGFLEGTKVQREEDNQLVDTIYQQGIEKGKDDMKEQMLEEAVEGTITCQNLNRYILVLGWMNHLHMVTRFASSFYQRRTNYE